MTKSKFKFIEPNWFTNRTYNLNFRPIPDSSGVYLLVHTNCLTMRHKILYVGSSKCLSKRYRSHEVLRFLNNICKDNCNVRFYFKEVENYLEEEKTLIKLIQPRFNKQWL